MLINEMENYTGKTLKPNIEIQICNYYNDRIGINVFRKPLKNKEPTGIRFRVVNEDGRILEQAVTFGFALYVAKEDFI